MRVRELQADCDRWGIAVSGSKSEILFRLRRLYSGEMVLQKGCATRYVQLIPEPLETAAAAASGSTTSAASAGRMPMTAPTAPGSTTATASAGRMPMTAPFDSAAYPDDHMSDYEPSPVDRPVGPEPPQPPAFPHPLPEGIETERHGMEVLDRPLEEIRQQQQQPRPDQRALRRRQRTRQLQRGFWTEVSHEDTIGLLESTLDYVQQEGANGWNKINTDTDLGKAWVSLEGGSADVSLILCSTVARRLKKPQPHAGPHDVPLRRSYLLLDDGTVLVLTTDWESWGTMSPASQVRPLVAPQRRLYLVLFGKEIGEEDAGEEPDQLQQREEARERKWQALPRELKLAISVCTKTSGMQASQLYFEP